MTAVTAEARRLIPAELKRAMARRGMTNVTLATHVGVTEETITKYRTGVSVPRLESGALLADALDWPKLQELVIAARERKCEACGVTIFSVGHGGAPRKWCTKNCGGRVYQRERRASDRTHKAADLRRATEERDRLRDAVRAMCFACEPEGQCRTAACELRPVSPLPLSSRRVA